MEGFRRQDGIGVVLALGGYLHEVMSDDKAKAGCVIHIEERNAVQGFRSWNP